MNQPDAVQQLAKLQEEQDKLRLANDALKKEVEAVKLASSDSSDSSDSSAQLELAWKELSDRKSLFSFMKRSKADEGNKDIVAEIKRLKDEAEVAAAAVGHLKKRLADLQKQAGRMKTQLAHKPAPVPVKPVKPPTVVKRPTPAPAAGLDPDQAALLKKLEELETRYQQASTNVDQIKADLVDELKKNVD